jgi:hypothetical protein
MEKTGDIKTSAALAVIGRAASMCHWGDDEIKGTLPLSSIMSINSGLYCKNFYDYENDDHSLRYKPDNVQELHNKGLDWELFVMISIKITSIYL